MEEEEEEEEEEEGARSGRGTVGVFDFVGTGGGPV